MVLRRILGEVAMYAVKRLRPLPHLHFEIQEKNVGHIAKVANLRKRSEFIYHILTDGNNFQFLGTVVEAMGKG